MPRRGDISDETVLGLYFGRGLNRRQTAEALGCSQDLVSYRLKKLGMKPKSMSECVISGNRRSVPMSRECLERLDGEMLGDGHINLGVGGSGSFRESFGHDKRMWAEWLMGFWMDQGVPVGSGIHVKKPSGKSPNPSFGFSTKETVELGNVHRRWYVRNNNFDPKMVRTFSNRKFIKTVPADIVLTARALLHWYIGDGTSQKHGGCMFYTGGFKVQECEYLRLRLLKDLGIRSTMKDGTNIYVPRADWMRMLEIAGECPVQCYAYKWEYSMTMPKPRNMDTSIDMNLVDVFLRGR